MKAVMERRRKELLSVREAADFLGLSVSTIRRYIRDGRLPAYRVAGERLLRIKRSDLEALLDPVFEGKQREP
ncbi:MAG TPA: DNA-binding protein [Anaerolineae bacterium]|nr:DNA-binding protein [Anaerolineae bacterium]